MNFSIIISNTKRSISYLKKLRLNNLTPNKIIYIDDKKKNKISRLLDRKKFFFPLKKVKKFKSKFINKKIENYLLKLNTKLIIYSGYPGVLIRNEKLLKMKKMLHSHPGKVPNYKGSTTIYYSLLKSNKIHCSSIFLNENLDNGQVIYVKEYPKPKQMKLINDTYDNYIRSQNLIHVLKNFSKLKIKNQKKNNYKPYYVIHPVLRSFAIHFK